MIRKPLDLNSNKKTLKIRAARLYSDIFSPPSAFAIFGFIVAWSDMPFWKGSLHAAIFGLLTSLMPIVYILSLLKRGLISDIHLSSPDERRIPYLLGVIGASLAYGVLRSLGSSDLFLDFILTNIIGLGALAVINSRWLISAHTSSITVITAFAGFAFSPKTALALFPLIVITCYIRHYLKRHTIGELISGVILGLTVVLGLVALGLFRDYHFG